MPFSEGRCNGEGNHEDRQLRVFMHGRLCRQSDGAIHAVTRSQTDTWPIVDDLATPMRSDGPKLARFYAAPKAV